MSSSDAIGGFFELELRRGKFLHADAVLLNSGRSCFEYVLRALKPVHVHLPQYTCEAVFEPLRNLAIGFSLYPIDPRLEAAEPVSLGGDELLVCNNYFGIKDSYCRSLAATYGRQLVIDASQAYYFTPSPGAHYFYSCRKFFGVPDGGCLHTSARLADEVPAGTSYERADHLLKRADGRLPEAYEDFKRHEAAFVDEPMRAMSPLTRRLLANIDYAAAERTRKQNFAYLHRALGSSNELAIADASIGAPLCYPYMSSRRDLRRKLIDSQVLVPTYWPEVLRAARPADFAYQCAEKILPLPIDQRYTTRDMRRLIDIING